MTTLLIGLLSLAVAPPPPTKAQVPPRALVERAEKARDAGQTDEALRLYKQAVATAPGWAEGWFWLGSIYYGQEKFTECRESFRKFTARSPKAGPGFALLAMCEYRLGDGKTALQHFETAANLGLPDDPMTIESRLVHVRLLIAEKNFERALLLLGALSMKSPDTPEMVTLAGIAALRKPIAPESIEESDREVIIRTGRAMLIAAHRQGSEARSAFEEILADYPQYPTLHYLYGALLVGVDPDRALSEFEKELAISGDHLPALVSAAAEYLRREEPEKALTYAQRAVRISPGNFAARTTLGRALSESGKPAEGVRELELAAKLAPDSPQVFLALASAYQKAGRKDDATRARAEFTRLKKMLDARAPE